MSNEKEYSEWMSKQGFDALRHANCCKIAFDGAWQHQQSKVDELTKQRDSFIKAYEIEINKSIELQNRVDAAQDTLTELKEKSEALHHRWNILSDSVALAEAEMIDMCVKELEQALKGGLNE